MLATVEALRRYPVKSMGGEALDVATLDARGLEGDRLLAVADADGRLASGKSTRRFRRRDAVFAYAAAVDATGVVSVVRGADAWRAGDPALDAALSDAMDAGVRIVEEGATPHHDAAPVSLVGSATLRWCEERWGVDADPRRLRVNLVVATSEPFVEESWIGDALAIGSTRLLVRERIVRCRTVDVPQDGAEARRPLLASLGAERDACLAVSADVAQPGVIRVGDAVHVA